MTLIQLNFNTQEENHLVGLNLYKGYEKVVIFLGGFCDSVGLHHKYNNIANGLESSSLFLDFQGIGLSSFGLSNDFYSEITIEKMSKDLETAVEHLIDYKYKKISVVAHSVSACVVAHLINKKQKDLFEEIIFIAPALNQKSLLRYWYYNYCLGGLLTFEEIQKAFKEEEYFEKDFLDYCNKGRIVKSFFIKSNYFLENKDKNYYNLLKDVDSNKIFQICGDSDPLIPLESLEKLGQIIKIKNGDHNFEEYNLKNEIVEKILTIVK